MAKIRTRIRAKAGYRRKRVGINATVSRHVTASGKPQFEACMSLAPVKGSIIGYSFACAPGRNPRVALGAAARKFGRKVTARRGAFAGISGYSKTNRKARRTRRASKRS